MLWVEMLPSICPWASHRHWGLFRVSYFCRKRKGIKILSYLLEKLVEHIPKKRASYFAQLINVWKLILANSKGFCPCDGSAYKSCASPSDFVEGVVTDKGLVVQ